MGNLWMLTSLMIAMLPRPYEGTLTVLSGHAAVIQADIATAQPKYYGLQGITVEASAVVLSGDFLCSPAAENVFRKIVIGDDRFAKCNHYDIFRALEAAGAVGFIHLVDRSTPIGWATFEHFSWSANAMISKNITVVEAYAEDLGFASTTLNLRARITPPHDETFADVYLSWHWTLVLRVMVPIMALRVTVSGTMGICNSWYLYCREEDPVNVQIKFASFFVCTIATSTAFLLGLICALGQWGPEVCPNYYHQFFVTGFYGTLMLTTSVSCCIMRERLRSFWQYPPRLLWPHNRFRLILIFVIGVGGDIFLGIFRMIGIENSAIFTSASFVTSGLISGITCIVLLAYAWALGKPILSMMNLRARAPQDQTLVMQQLFFVVVALTMNGTFSLLNLLSTVAFAYLQISASYRPLNYSLAMYWLVLARLGLMHWQIQLMKPRYRSASACLSLDAIHSHFFGSRSRNHNVVFPVDDMCSTITSAFSSPVVYQDFSIDLPDPSEDTKIEEVNRIPFTEPELGASVIAPGVPHESLKDGTVT